MEGAQVAGVPAAGGPEAVTAEPTRTRSGPRRALRWLLVPTAVLVAAWVWLGLTPHVGPGSQLWVASGLVEETDESSWDAPTTFVAVDPGPGEAWLVHSFRNDGRLPLTVTAPAPSLSATSSLLPIDRLQLGDVPMDRLTVAPGDEFAIRTVVDWPPCVSWEAGTSMGPGVVVLDVTTLGLTRTLTVPLEPDVMIRTSRQLSSPCDGE